jgi:hypothetical protein
MTEEKGTIVAPLYRGMPDVELTADRMAVVHELNSKEILNGPPDGPISISLESLDIDLQQSQSYGMVAAGTGCITSPTGPNC